MNDLSVSDSWPLLPEPGRHLDPDTARRLLGLTGEAGIPPVALRLLARSARLTRKIFGHTVELCAIINARSGNCSEDCAFCAQSARYKTPAPGYPMIDRDAFRLAAVRAREGGAVRFSIVTSGKAATDKEVDQACLMVEDMRRAGLTPCASMGCLDRAALERLASAGLDRYHHNLETSESFYPQICTSHDYSERVETLEAARATGLSLCSGGIFGLGESPDQRWEMIRELARLAVDSVAVNFLSPIPGTPLADRPPVGAAEALTILAVIRLTMPRVEIRTCGGRREALGEMEIMQFPAGANATMTGDYLTRSGPDPDHDRNLITSLGLTIATRAGERR